MNQTSQVKLEPLQHESLLITLLNHKYLTINDFRRLFGLPELTAEQKAMFEQIQTSRGDQNAAIKTKFLLS